MAMIAQQAKNWPAGLRETLVVQVPRALAASVLAALIDCAILFVLVEIAGWERVPASIAGYLVGSVFQYVMCSLWVFPGTSQNAVMGLLACTVLSLVGLAITWIVMALLASVHLALAKLTALGLAFCWNFLSRKYLLFAPSR